MIVGKVLIVIDNVLNTYFKWLMSLFIFVVFINLVFSKYINIISFTNLFLIITPNWLFTFYLNLKTNKINKFNLESYMKEQYPDILKDFYNNYKSDTNPDTKPIFALFLNKELLKDDYINKIKTSSNEVIMLFVSVSAISIMIFLISTVFIMKEMYFKN
jgi:hypothetical protein